MKIAYTTIWALLSIMLILTIVLREPNVESAGAIIQQSQYKEVESERSIDIIIIFLLFGFIFMTVFLFIQNK